MCNVAQHQQRIDRRYVSLPSTVTRYENGTDAYGSTLLKLRRAFEKAGLSFIDGNGEGPGVRFNKPIAENKKARRRI